MPAIPQPDAALKRSLRTLLRADSLAWRTLHGLNLRFQALFPPRLLEPPLLLEAWMEAGRPAPPPHSVKQRIVAAYASAFSIGTLIETGTYAGEMVFSMRDRFERIFSIELSDSLYRRARRRFRAFPRIRILRGDSGKVLPALLAGISARCLFWLDGHFSAGITARGDTVTPVMEEMEAILNHRIEDHVILIDDARLFDGAHGFPLVSKVRELVARKRPGWEFSVRNDVMRIHPAQAVASEF
jgi:hypothetical protein